jgi:hypothetical protein
MNIRRIQGTFLVLSLALAPWWASGQTGPSPGSQAPVPVSAQSEASKPSPEAALSLLNTATQRVREWNAQEAGVLQELRRGLARLDKGCATKAPTARAEASAPLAIQMSLQEALTLRENRAAAFERQTQPWSALAADLVARQCSGVANTLGLQALKSPSCKRAESVRLAVQDLRVELGAYHQALVERYRAYGGLARLEQQGCTRPGFAARLIQANDVHMRPAETSQLDMVDPWSRDIADLLRRLGEQP